VNLLVVGVSHRTAGVSLLERLAVPSAEAPTILARLLAQPYVGEAVVLSTCNRVEVYAAVSAFHGALTEIGSLFAARAGIPIAELARHMYVQFESDAVRHAFRVAAGLDSMVVGEAQILGQLRDAYGTASETGAAGRVLHEVMQHALRVGKRAHAETGIDRAGQSVVTAALAVGDEATGPVAGRAALVIGAGSMGALALATLKREGAGPLYIANRGLDRAAHVAAAYGATPVSYDDLAATLRTVDIAVCATASPGLVLDAATVEAAVSDREYPLLLLDLAVPRDVDPAVAELPMATLVDIEDLGNVLVGPADDAVRAAEEIVNSEVETFQAWLRGADVAPTVAALRARADDVVAAELRRLATRTPDLTDVERAEVAHTIHRVVQRLLHQPTVRVRQLAASPGGDAYAQVLRELFDLRVDGEIDPSAAGEVGPSDAGEVGP
jgi:glutamyl-tRNA reductase